ncbi:putative transcriptional regulator [Haloferula luteola]|uniref:Putative transcriptional regulator n=1 Tax=Haloferula luteola TaxID=595692 RepID=A0A840V0C5_9BACT|nr:YqgE/AlgH family protein [Haloferula luteola]MBB5350516.1 putative transcriptional regulator [Haloferula luteola]
MAGTSTRLSGSLLIASPTLRDGTFDHSVVLLAEHSKQEGAYGVILNQPTGREVSHFLNEPQFAPLSRVPVHMGGPVSRDQLIFGAFSRGPKNRLRFSLRLSVEDAIRQVKTPGVVLRAFVGYSGWSAGQLEGELQRDAWITAKANADLPGRPFDHTLWRELLESLSPFHRLLADAPPFPEWN